jgi:hypothetical protein
MTLPADRRWWLLPLLLVVLLTPGCEAIEGIFKAGFWVGILVAVFVVGLILWLVMGRRGA